MPLTALFLFESTKPNDLRTHRNYYLINRKPLIIVTSEQINDLQIFSNHIVKNNKAVFLVYFWWTLFDHPTTFEKIFEHYLDHQKKFKKHKIIFLLNTVEEFNIFKNQYIPCEFIHQNALVDQETFKPTNQKKIYDVIYNGRLEDLKRHYLLRDCSSIGLISAYVMNINKEKTRYLDELKSLLPGARLLNSDPPITLNKYNYNMGLQLFSGEEVNRFINQAKVGVILSSKEGACYASIEYLLAGIPVVSTRNIGGRNYFLDNRFCRIVPSRPGAIKNAVNEKNVLFDIYEKDKKS